MQDAPENQGGCLRVGLTVCFVCDTIVGGGSTKENATRDKVNIIIILVTFFYSDH